MEELRNLVAEKLNFPVEELSDSQVSRLVKTLGINVPRQVTIKEMHGGVYASVPPVVFKDAEGKKRRTRHFNIRAEAIDTLIDDLHVARKLLKDR